MFVDILLALAVAAAQTPTPTAHGVIAGVVVHAGDEKPAARAEVTLRATVEGELVPVAQTTADDQGRFFFRQLPTDPQIEYLPGANRDGIHYPGRPIRLSEKEPGAGARLIVHDAIRSPCPLVAKRHEIVIRPQPGAVQVIETILVENPTSSCYVGQAADSKSEPVTLRLSIPSDFTETTFQKEFFGRRFSLSAGKLVTSVPWTPGTRELKFTYLLANPKGQFHWQRPLDLPCSDFTLTIRSQQPDDMACDLGVKPERSAGQVTYRIQGRQLPVGQVIHVDLGRVPVRWTEYARWIALAILLAAVAGASLLLLRQRSSNRSNQAQPASRSPRSDERSTLRRRRKRAA